MKKIAVGDLGEFWYGDYKEPFEQLEGAVTGHPKGVDLTDDEGKILCAFCGKTFHNLGLHAKHSHFSSAAEYKREVGLLQGSALVSERVRVSMIAGSKRVNQVRRSKPAGFVSHTGGNFYRQPEYLNRTGRCYAQVIEVGKNIVAAGGRINRPTLQARGIGPLLIEAYFGSYDEFRRLLGTSVVGRRRWSDDQLLSVLTALAEKIGRTPAVSDLHRYGLPDQATFCGHFGSYGNACRAAGLDPNLPTPQTLDIEVAVLTAYATIGSIKRAARAVGIGSPLAAKVLEKYGAPFFVGGYGPTSTKERREWAGNMARRLAGVEDAA